MTFHAVTQAVEKQQDYESVFPLVYSAEHSGSLREAALWLSERRQELFEQVDLHGAVLLRGFPVASDKDFDQVIQSFDAPNFTYADSLSNAVRINRTERVFTANEAPPDVGIYLHHEMAQTPIYPAKLFFFCEQAAESGGATPICRSDILLSRLAQDRSNFVAACIERGVKYTNIMPAVDDPKSGQGRSWRSTLGVDNRREAEARLSALGYTWIWRDNEILSVTTPVLPAVYTLKDGRQSFFNQLIAAFRGWADARNDPSKSIRFGDDTPIDADDMNVAIQLSDELTFDLSWQTGDVAIIDNFSVMHGRRPFNGTRKVLVSLVANA
ncbi:MAG: TauD/TfdA family dioxygenase [Pseudomonadota bacterium]